MLATARVASCAVCLPTNDGPGRWKGGAAGPALQSCSALEGQERLVRIQLIGGACQTLGAPSTPKRKLLGIDHLVKRLRSASVVHQKARPGALRPSRSLRSSTPVTAATPRHRSRRCAFLLIIDDLLRRGAGAAHVGNLLNRGAPKAQRQGRVTSASCIMKVCSYSRSGWSVRNLLFPVGTSVGTGSSLARLRTTKARTPQCRQLKRPPMSGMCCWRHSADESQQMFRSPSWFGVWSWNAPEPFRASPHPLVASAQTPGANIWTTVFPCVRRH